MRLEAPAKLNLSLAVTGRRADGYHTLATQMALVEVADRLLLMPGGTGLRVETPPGEEIPTAPQQNLAWQGLLEGTGGVVPMALLALEKRIPSAAGLGGGSSDAAAAWRLGRRWLSLGEAVDAALLEALSHIGADVPFFAAQHPVALVQGIGEQVTATDFPPGGDHVVLVHPPFAMSTGAVFAELRKADWSGGQVPDGTNDLLGPARRLRPELDDVFRIVIGAGGRPQLSGSGPTVFVRTDDPDRAAAISRRLERAGLRSSRTRLRREPASIEEFEDELEDG